MTEKIENINSMISSVSDRKKILIIAIVVGIGILVLGIMAIYMINQGEQCVSNPLTYGLQKIYDADNIETQCTCYILSGEYQPFRVTRLEVTPNI